MTMKRGSGNVGRGDFPNRKSGQQTLDATMQKKVQFEEGMLQEEINALKEEVKKLKREAKKGGEERDKDREAWGKTNKRLENLEVRVTAMEEKMNEMWEWLQGEEEENESDAESSKSGRSRRSVMSRVSITSMASGASAFSRMSQGEFRTLRNMARKAEIDDRRNNIVIRGARKLDEKELTVSVEKFLKDKLEVEVKVENAWMSGKVYVAKMEKYEDKIKVMEKRAS